VPGSIRSAATTWAEHLPNGLSVPTPIARYRADADHGLRPRQLVSSKCRRDADLTMVNAATASAGNAQSAIKVTMDLQNPVPANAPCCRLRISRFRVGDLLATTGLS
jgi:hypothetical protein